MRKNVTCVLQVSDITIIRTYIAMYLEKAMHLTHIYRMEGTLAGGNVGELIRFEHLAKESLVN